MWSRCGLLLCFPIGLSAVALAQLPTRPCPACKGHPKSKCVRCDGGGFLNGVSNPCPKCHGLGAVVCPTCGGTGKQPTTQPAVKVTSPPSTQPTRQLAAMGRAHPLSSSTKPTPTEPKEAPAIPKDVTYTIIETHKIPGIKRSLDVRLNRRVSEGVLRSIAMELKSSDPATYERTFIVYLLPDMKVGAGAWATTHFNPNLEVRILGLTVEQEQRLRTETRPASRVVVGSWLDESAAGTANKVTIFREGGKLFMERKYPDGSSGKQEMIEKRVAGGMRFEKKAGSQFGEYYLIDRQGNLQCLDRDGQVWVAGKVE